jgi:hypothetical protein
MNRVVTIIISYVEVAIPVLPLGSFFVSTSSLFKVNYRPDGLGYNDVAIAVNELHVSKELPI